MVTLLDISNPLKCTFRLEWRELYDTWKIFYFLSLKKKLWKMFAQSTSNVKTRLYIPGSV